MTRLRRAPGLAAALLALLLTVAAAPPASPAAVDLERHVLALTAPEMEGRGSGPPVGDRAARYIAAERAGLRAGDVLVRLADTGLHGFADLREQLGRRRPGETLQLVYLREGLDHAASVTLAARP